MNNDSCTCAVCAHRISLNKELKNIQVFYDCDDEMQCDEPGYHIVDVLCFMQNLRDYDYQVESYLEEIKKSASKKDILKYLSSKEDYYSYLLGFDPIAHAVKVISWIFIIVYEGKKPSDIFEQEILSDINSNDALTIINRLISEIAPLISFDKNNDLLLKLAVINRLKDRVGISESLCEILDDRLKKRFSKPIEDLYSQLTSDIIRQSRISAKPKSPCYIETVTIIKNTIKKYPNASITSLVVKISDFYNSGSSKISNRSPSEKTLRKWLSNLGYKPIKPVTNRYNLVLK